jgi:hypothetical protein
VPVTRARILPFPLVRRRALVERLAGQMLSRAPADADKHLARELRRHRTVLSRRHLAEDAIEAQLRALERAARSELWRLVFIPQKPSSKA